MADAMDDATAFGPEIDTNSKTRLTHGVIYHDPASFAAWPFNAGSWRTRDGGLVVAFWRNECRYRTATDCSHRRRIQGPGAELVVVRSHDRGRTWSEPRVLVSNPGTGDLLLASGVEGYAGEDPVDFSDADVLLASGTVPNDFAEDGRAWLSLSADGGRTWRQATLLPRFGFRWVHGRSAHVVRPDGVCLLCLTVPRPDGSVGRPVVVASNDGGRTWFFLAFMRPPTMDHITFCARPLLLPDGRIIAAMRCQVDRRSAWTEIYASDDGGRTWGSLARVNDVGAPADLALLPDGRLVCVYGYRVPPYGIRARVSSDGGARWSAEITLRNDGGSWDLGYPRALVLDDGAVLAVYYMNLERDPVQLDGGVRHIAWTEFRADDIS